MKTDDRNKILDKMEIGQIKFVTDWLHKCALPYKQDDIKRIVDDKGYTMAFEIFLDKDAMLKEYENDSIIPAFIKNGSIKLKITL